MKKLIATRLLYGISAFLIILSINHRLPAEPLKYRRLVSLKAQQGKDDNRFLWNTVWCHNDNPWWNDTSRFGDLRPIHYYNILIGENKNDHRDSNGGELMMIVNALDPEKTGDVKVGDPINILVMATRKGSWENTNLGFGARWFIHKAPHGWFNNRPHILITMSPYMQGPNSQGDAFSLATVNNKPFGTTIDTNDIININHATGFLTVIQHRHFGDHGTIVIDGPAAQPSKNRNFNFIMLDHPTTANNEAFGAAEAFSDSPNIAKKLYTGAIIRLKGSNGKYVQVVGTTLTGNGTDPQNAGNQFRLHMHSSGLFGLESVASPGYFLAVDPGQVTYMHDREWNYGRARNEDTKRRMEGNVSLVPLPDGFDKAAFKKFQGKQMPFLWFIEGTLNKAFMMNAASNTWLRSQDARVATGTGHTFGYNDEIRLNIEVFQGIESPDTIAAIAAAQAKAAAAQAKAKADAETAQAAAAKQMALSFANQFAKTETGQPRIFALVANEDKCLKIIHENKQPLLKTTRASLDQLQDQSFMFTAEVYEDGSVGLISKRTNKLLQADPLNANSSDGFVFAHGQAATNASSWILTRPANSTSLDKVSFKNKGNQGYLSIDATSEKVSTGAFASPIDYIKNGAQQAIANVSQFKVVDISPFTYQLTQALTKTALSSKIQSMASLMSSASTDAEKKLYIKELEVLVNRRTPAVLPALEALLNTLISNTPVAFTRHDIINTTTGAITSQIPTQDYINYAKEIMQFMDVAKTRRLSIVNKKGKVGLLNDKSMSFSQPGTGVISCKVKATDSFAITLSTRNTTSTVDNATYAVYFGMNHNTQTVIKKKGKPVKAYQTKEALLQTDGNFHTYWVAIEKGVLSCGIDTPLGQTPAITWNDPDIPAEAVRFIGFSCNESPVEIQEITLYKSLTDLQLQKMAQIGPRMSIAGDRLKSGVVRHNQLKNTPISEQLARLRSTIYSAADTPERRRLFVKGLEHTVKQSWKMTPEQKNELKEFISQVIFMREFGQDSAPISEKESATLHQKLMQLSDTLIKERPYIEKIHLLRKTIEEDVLTLAQDNPERKAFFQDKLDAFIKEKEPKTTEEINLIKNDILLFLKYGKNQELSPTESSKVETLLNSITGIKDTPPAQMPQPKLSFQQMVQDYRKKVDEVLALPTNDSRRLALIDTELGNFIRERNEKTAESRTMLTNELLMYTKYGKPGSLTEAENKAVDKHLAALTKEAEDSTRLAESFSYKVTQAKDKLEKVILLPLDNQDRMKFFDEELGKLIADNKTKTAADRTLLKDHLLLYAKYGKANQLSEPEKLVLEKHLDTLKKEEATPAVNAVAKPVSTVPQQPVFQYQQGTPQSGIYVPRTMLTNGGMGSMAGIRRPQLRRR